MMVLLKLFPEPPFFFKMAAIPKKRGVILCLISMKIWYLGVHPWRCEHDPYRIKYFCSEPPFFFQMAAILQKFLGFVRYQWKCSYQAGVPYWCGDANWWYYAAPLFPVYRPSVLHKCHLSSHFSKQLQLFLGVFMMWWIWWYYRNIFPSTVGIWITEWLPCTHKCHLFSDFKEKIAAF